MPYQRNSDLPEDVKDALPTEAQTVFRTVFNDTEERYDNEGRAFATAWTAVQNGWRRTSEGEWVRKAEGDASTPAPPGERRRGSERNPSGSASSSAGSIEISEVTETALRNKVREHNEEHGEAGKRATLGALKAVYRRGAGAYSTSHRPGMTRNQWAMGRVNAFLTLLRTGKPENAKYTTDNDLLPSGHPRKTTKVDKAESFSPPEAVRNAARRGLALREKWGRGGLSTQEAGKQGIGSGVARARDLSSGKSVSAETIGRMVSFFARHEQNKDGTDDDGGPSAGAIAWKLWGGDAGMRWANSIKQRLDKGDDGELEFDQRIIHKADKQRYTLGVVYEPNSVDSQEDWTDESEIEKACWNFMRKLAGRGKLTKIASDLIQSVTTTLRKGEAVRMDVTDLWDEIEKADELINDMHVNTNWEDVPDIVECYLAPADFELGKEKVKKGTWLMGIIWPSEYFERIEAGERTGLSMEGRGRRVESDAPKTD